MSNSQMLKYLVDEIPNTEKKFENLEQQISGLKSDIVGIDRKIDGVAANLQQLNFKADQNHICLMTNHEDMEKRIAVLEAA